MASSRQRVTRDVAPAAVAGAGGGQHHRVAAVRQQVRARRRGVRRWQAAGRRAGRRSRTGRVDFASAAQGRATATSRGVRSCSSSSVAWTIGSAWNRVAHRAVQQRVGDGDDGHALMVRHVGAHDRDVCALRQPARRVVERLVEAVAAARADAGEPREIARRRRRIDHGRERRRVGRDHGILAQAALQPEAGNAEIRVLVGELQVAGVVGGFRNAPGQAERRRRSSICRRTTSRLVCSSRLPAGARITSDGIRYSNIDPDQEISAAPSRDRRHGAAEPEPVRAPERRPWRWRRSSPAAPRRRADRSSSGRGVPSGTR